MVCVIVAIASVAVTVSPTSVGNPWSYTVLTSKELTLVCDCYVPVVWQLQYVTSSRLVCHICVNVESMT